MDKLLESILTTKRCHNSKGELAFLAWLHGYIKTLGHEVVPMAEGCTAVKVGKNGARTLFSCHIDTVHSGLESDGSTQKLVFDESFQHIFLGDKTTTCMGADDGAGIFILLKMIEAKVEGTYIFHRGEEKGGIGARAMVLKHSKFLEEFDRSIAFDRPGNDEVIITQGGSICASPAFGTQLSELLTAGGLKYENSIRGVFTDNKCYRQIIPCNVNLGVGYQNQHGNQEYQDWAHLSKLTEIACKLDWESLKVVRKIESEPEIPRYSQWANQGRQHSMYDDGFGGFDYSEYGSKVAKVKAKGKGKEKFKEVSKLPPPPVPKLPMRDGPSYRDGPNMPDSSAELEMMTFDDIVDWCETGDPVDFALCFSKLIMKLDVERAKVARYEILLGMD